MLKNTCCGKTAGLFSFLFVFLFTSFAFGQGNSCATATSVTVGTTYTYSLTNPIVETGVPNVNGQNPNLAAWVSFVANSTAATVTLTASNRNPILYVYSSCGTYTTPFASKNDTNTNGAQTETLSLTGLTIGNTYYVLAGNVNSNPMNITAFSITSVISNDNCSGAIALTVNPTTTCTSSTSGTTIGATQSISALLCSGYTGNANDDVWYSFTATSSTHIITVNSGSGFDAVVDLRSGACNGTNLNCADNTASGGVETITASGLTPLSTYYIRVYGYGGTGTEGNFSICVTTLPVCTTPAAQPTALVFGTTTTTSIAATFTAASPTANKYLVVYSTSASAPVPGPVFGTTYTAGNTFGGATVVSAAAATSFTASGLTAGTQYYFYVYAYNDTSCSGPAYNTVTPLTNNRATVCANGSSAIALTAVTTTSATISWTGGSYILEYGLSGFTPGTSAAAGTGGTIASATATSAFLISGLSQGTTYDVYLRKACTLGGYYTNSPVFTFTTSCSTTTVPYYENFETAIVPAVPNCTSVVNAGSGNTWTVSNSPGSGFLSKTLQYAYNISNAANTYFFTKGVTLTAGTVYRLAFRYGAASTGYNERMSVFYGSSPSVSAMTTLLLDFQPINTFNNYTYADFTPATTGVYYMGFQARSLANKYNLYVDDIALTLKPDCTIAKTLPYTEPFEISILPDCWTFNLVNPTLSNSPGGAINTNSSSRITMAGSGTENFTESCGSGTIAFNVNPPSGSTFMVKYNSFSPTTPDQGNPTGFREQLVSPKISTSGTSAVQLEFDWMEIQRTCFTNPNSSNIREGITVQWSLDGINWENINYFPRHTSTAAASGTWTHKTVYLPSAAGNQSQVYIAFLFHSEWGYNMYIDNVSVKAKVNPCLTTTTWNGTSWSPTTPNGTTTAVINAPYSGGSFTCCSLTLNANMTIADGQTIEILDDFSGSGTVTMSSLANLIQYNNSASGPNIVLTKTTINKRKWDYIYWGAPISGGAGTFPSWVLDSYQWNAGVGGNWSGVTDTSPGRGFITRVKNISPYNVGLGSPVSWTFTGTANNGIVKRTVAMENTSSSNNNNFNMLANPYPSAIKTRDFLSMNPNLGSIYFWTSNSQYLGSGAYSVSDYAVWNFSGGVSANAQGAPPAFIGTAQGFFVQSTENTSVYFTDSMRQSASNSLFFRNSETESEPATDRYWLTLTDDQLSYNQILVAHVQGATYGNDLLYDADRNSASPIKMYTLIGDGTFSINGRPAFDINDIIPLGFSKTDASLQYFSIALSQKEGLFDNGQPVYIFDSLNNQYFDLTQGPFQLELTEMENNTRYKLVYQTNGQLAVNSPVASSSYVTALIHNHKLQVNSSQAIADVAVFDLTGKLVGKYEPASDTLKWSADFNFAAGIYIAKIRLGNGTSQSVKLVNR